MLRVEHVSYSYGVAHRGIDDVTPNVDDGGSLVALAGPTLLMASDTLARVKHVSNSYGVAALHRGINSGKSTLVVASDTLAPVELPVGAITALLGVLFFLSLLRSG
ncbi:MAG TPA: hypothetical protein VGJ82_01310, partial [Thermoanaerobaculia bacterium]